MPTLRLDDRTLAGLKPAERTRYFDSHTPGLMLRVSAATARQDGRGRVWYFRYRYQGRQELLRLGTYPGTTLKEAREAVGAARKRLDHGENPAAEKRTPPPAPPAVYTFADFVPVFVAFQKDRGIKTWHEQENKIAKYLTPAWGDRALASLRRRDVQELLTALTQTGGRKGKGLKGGVTGVQAIVSRMFTVALNLDLIDQHPAARIIKRFLPNPGQRKLSDAELRALWAGLEAQPGAASDAMKLRLLLGQRGAETAGMLWSELDLVDGVWSLPRERTKNKTPHVIGLPPTALALLTTRRAAVDAAEPRVFPGLKLTGHDHKALAVIHGGAYEWKDLRRTVSTRLGALGYENETIDRIQNRKQYSVTAVHYNHAQYVEPIRAALTKWDDGLARILRGEPMIAKRERGRVLPMSARPGAGA